MVNQLWVPTCGRRSGARVRHVAFNTVSFGVDPVDRYRLKVCPDDLQEVLRVACVFMVVRSPVYPMSEVLVNGKRELRDVGRRIQASRFSCGV